MDTRIHNFAYLFVAMICVATTGCSMCCGPFDYDYPTFGGKHQRSVRDFGRVGSILSDPTGAAVGPAADSNLKPVDPAPDIDLDSELDDIDRIDDFETDSESDFDRSLETIEPEPLREGSATPEQPAAAEDDKSTAALNRWRPSSLRSQYR